LEKPFVINLSLTLLKIILDISFISEAKDKVSSNMK